MVEPSATPDATKPPPSATLTPSATVDWRATFTPAPTPAECFEWFFPDPPPECAFSLPFRSPAAAQHFEHGLLLWTAQPDRFYIFVDHPTLRAFLTVNAPYTFLPQSAHARDAPPPNRYAPLSGFGRLWRGEMETFNVNFSNLGELLGWAVEPEYGYEFVSQCQRAASRFEERCFLSDGAGAILFLRPASATWGRWSPADTRVDVPVLDAVIEAVMTRDAKRLQTLIHFTTMGCTHAEGLGGPAKCLAEEAEGALVEGLPFVAHEGGVVRREEIEQIVHSILGEQPVLYAVYRQTVETINESDWLPAQYGIVFAHAPGYMHALMVDEIGIVRLYSGESPADLERFFSGEYLLPPR
jgi:hypothetical protein